MVVSVPCLQVLFPTHTSWVAANLTPKLWLDALGIAVKVVKLASKLTTWQMQMGRVLILFRHVPNKTFKHAELDEVLHLFFRAFCRALFQSELHVHPSCGTTLSYWYDTFCMSIQLNDQWLACCLLEAFTKCTHWSISSRSYWVASPVPAVEWGWWWNSPLEFFLARQKIYCSSCYVSLPLRLLLEGKVSTLQLKDLKTCF